MGIVQTEGFDLNTCVEYLKEKGRLQLVEEEVDPRHQLAALAVKFEGREPVLFTRVKNSSYPVLAGLYWNRDILAEIFGIPKLKLPHLIRETVLKWRSSPVEPTVVDSGPANQVEMRPRDLGVLPVPTHFPEDGGPYFLSSVVIARDPDTGVRNASVNRCMVSGSSRLTMLMDSGRHLRDYYERARSRGKALEITINNGVDPTVYLASVVPPSSAPLSMDELGIASGLLGRPLQLLRAKTVNVEGVANSQFIVEGRILPDTMEPEGPCAEVTGYYAASGERWVVEVSAITCREDPLFHTLLPGKEVFNSVGLTGEANVCALVQSQVPEVKNVYFPHGGCGFYQAVIQLEKRTEGSQKNAIMAAFAAFPSLRVVTAVDEDVDIYDPEDVDWAVSTRFDPDRDLIIVRDARSHELNPMSRDGIGSKMGIDATAPFPRPQHFKRASYLRQE